MCVLHYRSKEIFESNLMAIIMGPKHEIKVSKGDLFV